jgi:hypothetical protein
LGRYTKPVCTAWAACFAAGLAVAGHVRILLYFFVVFFRLLLLDEAQLDT